MKNYKLEIKLLSDALIGSGEGFGAVIDSDIVFDKYGIPYVPAKRIKGCLRDSALEVCEIFKNSQIGYLTNYGFDAVKDLFGVPGKDKPSPLYISNLTIKDYDTMLPFINYFSNKYENIVNSESLRKIFTQIRQQTSIEYGVAKEHSLRTVRVAKKNIIFRGDIELEEENKDFIKLLFLACINLKRFGTKRNRGFGEIKCRLYEDGKEMNLLKELEDYYESH